MSVTFKRANTVTLNLFQGPFRVVSSRRAARWMLKQVQHDAVGGVK
jgi:hypothetical protein